MNENESYLFHVEQPVEWHRTPDHFWILGWFISKTDNTIIDIRAFVDDVAVTGFMGLPRPDIEAAFPGWIRGRSPGFALRIEPWVGVKKIRLEVQNQNYDWSEFWRVKTEFTGKGECSRYKPELNPKLIEMMYLRLLKHGALHGSIPMETQAMSLVRNCSIQLVNVLPQPPLRGQFEKPELIVHTQYNKMSILGWLFNEEKPIKRILATTDSVNYNVLVHGIEREDVGKKYAAFPQAKFSRFQGIIDVSQIAPNPLPLKIFAEYEDGTRELAFAKRVFQWSCMEKESRLPPYEEAHFKAVKAAIEDGCRKLHVNPGGMHFWKESRRLERMWEKEAQATPPWFTWHDHSLYQSNVLNNQLRPRLRAELQKAADALAAADGPLFSLLVDTRKADWDHLNRLARSLREQIYARWELKFVIRAEETPTLTAKIKALAGEDNRVTFAHGEPDENFALTTNKAVGAACGNWLMFPATDARFAPEGLLMLAEAAAVTEQELVLADEDYMTEHGRRHDPILKCRWSPEAVYSGTHPGQCVAITRQIFEATGGFEPEFHMVMLAALSMRLPEVVNPAHTAHVTAVAYHRDSENFGQEATDEEVELYRLAITASLARRQMPARAFRPPFAVEKNLPVHQLFWEPTELERHRVTIVIPTRDHCDLLERCIQALLQTVNWKHVKLVIVDDFSREEKAVRFLKCLTECQDFSCQVVQPDVDPLKPFNYSRLVNAAEPYIDTSLVLHLNNDVDALRPGWIEEMVGWFSDPTVGVVGARLLYANNHINHAGVIVGPHFGLADVPFAGMGPHDDAPFELHKITRNTSAVTGACLMTRADLYRHFNGFDEKHLGVCYNDVDYCLRLAQAGFRTVYTPQAELWHWGSASRGTAYYPDEHIAFSDRYRNFKDPYWSRLLELEGPRVAIDRYHYLHTKRLDKLHMVVVTHNLNYEGAPLFLFEYNKFLIEELGFRIDVVSAEEGPLRKAYEAMGSRIILVDRHPLHGARNDTEFAEQLEVMRHKLQQQIDLGPVDLFVCNTVACWWGIHLANAVKKPSLFYIHESASLKRFFSTMLPKDRLDVARQAFRMATRVCFLCKATRAYYEELNDYENFRYVSSWIDLKRIHEIKASIPRTVARDNLGFAQNEMIIANIGTVCERKGQHAFIRSVDHYMKNFAGGGKFRFLIVGGRPGEFQDSLIADIEMLGLSDVIQIINETDRAYEYFRAANMFVCTSFEESFPRVLLEAMAFETPIVSTHVHGIPEMVTDQAEAYLVPPGQPIQFAKAIKTCLDKLQYGTDTTPMAYAKVYRGYDLVHILPKHADLAREAVLDYDGNTKRHKPRNLFGNVDRFETSW